MPLFSFLPQVIQERFDRIATHLLVFEGDSRVRWFEGNYQSYEEHMRKTVGTDWRPHRIRYRPLMRA